MLSPSEKAYNDLVGCLTDVLSLAKEINYPSDPTPFFIRDKFNAFLDQFYQLITVDLRNPNLVIDEDDLFTGDIIAHFDKRTAVGQMLRTQGDWRLGTGWDSRAACILGELHWRSWGFRHDPERAASYFGSACFCDPYANFAMAYYSEQVAAKASSEEEWHYKYNHAIMYARRAIELGFAEAELVLSKLTADAPSATAPSAS